MWRLLETDLLDLPERFGVTDEVMADEVRTALDSRYQQVGDRSHLDVDAL